MTHNWIKAIDGTGNTVRVVLFDYRKAFDLIDHHLLAEKVIQLHTYAIIHKILGN